MTPLVCALPFPGHFSPRQAWGGFPFGFPFFSPCPLSGRFHSIQAQHVLPGMWTRHLSPTPRLEWLHEVRKTSHLTALKNEVCGTCPVFSSFLQGYWKCFNHVHVQTKVENENSAQSFSDRSFWRSLRVVAVRAFGWLTDVRVQMLVFPGFGGPWPKFWAGISARTTPGCPRDIRPKNFLFGLLSRPWKWGFSKPSVFLEASEFAKPPDIYFKGRSSAGRLLQRDTRFLGERYKTQRQP